ncbi:uncharacterized protein LOC144444877 [Glandiceps talaboti]
MFRVLLFLAVVISATVSIKSPLFVSTRHVTRYSGFINVKNVPTKDDKTGEKVPDKIEAQPMYGNERKSGNVETRQTACTDMSMFQCDNDECVYAFKQCDSIHDCSDGSDESSCSGSGLMLINFVGFGTFMPSGKLYSNDTFTGPVNPTTDFPIEICDGTLIYFGIVVDTVDDGLELFAKNCYISESENPESSATTYDFIVDGCLGDSVVVFEVSPTDELEKHFGVSLYDIVQGMNAGVGQDIDLYIHCYAVICIKEEVGTPCDMGCMNTRKRRTVPDVTNESTNAYVSTGPFTATLKKRCIN